jgi:hypothetical protein
MPLGRCSFKLSSHKLQSKLRKSQAPSEAEGSAVHCTCVKSESKYRPTRCHPTVAKGPTVLYSAPIGTPPHQPGQQRIVERQAKRQVLPVNFAHDAGIGLQLLQILFLLAL